MDPQSLSDLLRSIQTLRQSGVSSSQLADAIEQLNGQVVLEDNPEVLYELIDRNATVLCLPYDTLSLVFQRFCALGERTPRVLEWFASMTMFYGDPEDWQFAEGLKMEALDLRRVKG